MESMDPRLAALYDEDNPDGPDHDHYRSRADELGPASIVDLGCGTGLLTVTLARPGRTVTGIDPDAGMLAVARSRPGSELVEWVDGDSRMIRPDSADLVIMTGNVAQHILPADWGRTLGDIAVGLRPGGVVTFESRNPDREAWRDWQPDNTRSTRETPQGPMTEWLETSAPDDHGTVVLTAHNVFARTGEDSVILQPLTFRGVADITADLAAVGLAVTDVWGGWAGEPFGPDSPIMVIEARDLNGRRS